MAELASAIPITDDLKLGFEALAHQYHERKINPRGIEGAGLACYLIDVLQSGPTTGESIAAGLIHLAKHDAGVLSQPLVAPNVSDASPASTTNGTRDA